MIPMNKEEIKCPKNQKEFIVSHLWEKKGFEIGLKWPKTNAINSSKLTYKTVTIILKIHVSSF